MYRFGTRSKKKIEEIHPRLQLILEDAIELMDLSVICGYRGEMDQNIAFDSGKSKLKYPESRHNRMPSKAVDIAPYPIDWNNIDRFRRMGWMIKGIAQARGIKITWGGDWRTLKDYPHFELED